jgi:general secretion pathway protein L
MARRGVEKIPMSLLRIYAPLGEAPLRCEWVLIDERRSMQGEGTLAELPRGADRVQLVIPAAQVLIARAKLPQGARRRAGPVLAFAVEVASAAEPDANQVSWLGAAGDADALAVVDKQGLKRWRDALEAVGLRATEVHAETLLLPHSSGEWSLAWNGGEGFVRTGEFEGAATDGGDQASPPLSLRMLLEEAQARGEAPRAIAVYVTAPGAAPDLKRWELALGVPMRLLGPWDWRMAPEQAGIGLAQERRRWRMTAAALASLRPAAWIAGAALAIHGAALIADWMLLGSEQRAVRAQMEARFRRAFPDAVAVADPALQMRRQLAAARHRAGVPDGGDFAPMIEKVATGLKDLPAGALRTVSYESGRMTLELAATEEAALRRIVARLTQTGLIVDVTGTKLITVRAL